MHPTRKDYLGIASFLAPGILLFITFFIIPIGYIAVVSLMEWNGMTAPTFVGIDNFVKLFGKSAFQRSVRNNLLWALAGSLVQVPMAMIMGMILARKPRGWKLFRTVYFFPQVISGVAMATMWQAVYNAEYGLLNGIVTLLGRPDLCRNWLGTLQSAFPAMLIYWVFYIGYYMVIMLSEITGIDETYYEAAAIDGANPIQQDIHITFPLIAHNSLLTCVTLAAVMGLRQFEQVYMMTNGGPANRTSVMVLYLYKSMQNYKYGEANATGVTLILMGVMVITLLRFVFKERDIKLAYRGKGGRSK